MMAMQMPVTINCLELDPNRHSLPSVGRGACLRST